MTNSSDSHIQRRAELQTQQPRPRKPTVPVELTMRQWEFLYSLVVPVSGVLGTAPAKPLKKVWGWDDKDIDFVFNAIFIEIDEAMCEMNR